MELRAEVGFHDPERFDALEAKFFSWYEKDGLRFIRNCISFYLDKGICPVREWMRVEKYPMTWLNTLFLKARNDLTEKSFREFIALMNRFFIKLENDAAFRDYDARLRKHGQLSLEIWIKKQGFFPVLKTEARTGQGGE